MRDHNGRTTTKLPARCITKEAKERMSILRPELRFLVLTASASELHQL